MKKIQPVFIALFFLLLSTAASAQNTPNWTDEQLMQPAVLAKALTEKEALPLIISVGPGALIPHSEDIGPANEAANETALKALLAGKKKDTKVVVYCGCCPFDRCPNVRPALQVLKDAGFAQYYLLNLKTNLKTDWIDKGYPTVK